MHKLWNVAKTNIVQHNTALNNRCGPPKKTGWKWQEASLTSNQTKLNKTFPLRQRAGKTLARDMPVGENFSWLSFSSACPGLEPAFPKTATNYNIDATLPAVQCSVLLPERIFSRSGTGRKILPGRRYVNRHKLRNNRAIHAWMLHVRALTSLSIRINIFTVYAWRHWLLLFEYKTAAVTALVIRADDAKRRTAAASCAVSSTMLGHSYFLLNHRHRRLLSDPLRNAIANQRSSACFDSWMNHPVSFNANLKSNFTTTVK